MKDYVNIDFKNGSSTKANTATKAPSLAKRAMNTVKGMKILGPNTTRALGVAGIATTGLSGIVSGLNSQKDRSYEDIQNRGGFMASTVKDGLPFLAGIGTAIGEGVGSFLQGPIVTPELNPKASTVADKTLVATGGQSTLSGQVGTQTTTPIAPAPSVQALVAEVPEPARAVPQSNGSYFINNGLKDVTGGRGIAPGKKQYFRDLEQSFPQREVASQSAAVPNTETLVNGVPTSKLPARYEGSHELPRTSRSSGSLGAIWAQTLENAGGVQRTIAGKKEERARSAQAANLKDARDYNTKLVENNRNYLINLNKGERADTRIVDNRNNAQLNVLARLRGQDKVAAGKVKVEESLSYADQASNNIALEELTRQQFTTAPPEFVQAVPGLVSQGVSLAQVKDAYQQVVALQAKATGAPVEDLDPQMLYDEVVKMLGISQ